MLSMVAGLQGAILLIAAKRADQIASELAMHTYDNTKAIADLPDAHMEIDHVVDGGDEAFVEGRFVGTHSGDFMTPEGAIPASNNKVELRFADFFKAAGGKVVEHRTYWDSADMMRQLGAM
jgi:predicted ester cyclase